jgi:hypothetical protein
MSLSKVQCSDSRCDFCITYEFKVLITLKGLTIHWHLTSWYHLQISRYSQASTIHKEIGSLQERASTLQSLIDSNMDQIEVKLGDADTGVQSQT